MTIFTRESSNISPTSTIKFKKYFYTGRSINKNLHQPPETCCNLFQLVQISCKSIFIREFQIFIDTNFDQPVQTYSNFFQPVPISRMNYILTQKSLNIVPTSINKLLVYFYTGSSINLKPKLAPTCENLL